MRILKVMVQPQKSGKIKVVVMGTLTDGRYYAGSAECTDNASVGATVIDIAADADGALQGVPNKATATIEYPKTVTSGQIKA